MDFNRARDQQISLAAEAVEMNDPRLRALLDKMLVSYSGRTYDSLSAGGKAAVSMFGGFASNYIGAKGNAAAGFGAINDAIGSTPLRFQDAGGSMSTSTGVGTNSISIAQQVAMDIQNQANSQGRVNGLSSNLAMGAIADIIKQNKGVGVAHEVSLAGDSKALTEQLRDLTNQGLMDKDSTAYKQLSRIRDATKSLEEKGASVGNISEGIRDALKSEGFTEEEILSADKTRSNKMSATFLDKSSMDDMKRTLKRYSSTLDNLSEMFHTDDMDHIKKQMEHLGVTSLMTEAGSDKAKKLMTFAKEKAIQTGKSTDAILSDMGAVASAVAATNGGKASAIGTMFVTNAVHEADKSDKSGNSVLTKEEKQSIAFNQEAEANDQLKETYAAMEAIRQAESDGVLTKSQQGKAAKLKARLQNLDKLDPDEAEDELKRIQSEYKSLAQDELGMDVSDEFLQRKGIANKDIDGTSILARAYGGNALKDDLRNRFSNSKALKSGRLDTVSDAANILMHAVGNDDDTYEFTRKTLIGKGSKSEKMQKLIDELGFSKDDAAKLVNANLSAAEINAISQSRTARSQNVRTEGYISKNKAKEEAHMRAVMESQDITNTKKGTAESFIAGLLQNGGLDHREVVANRMNSAVSSEVVGEFGGVKIGENGAITSFGDEDKKYGSNLQKLLGANMSEDAWNKAMSDPKKIQKLVEKFDGRVFIDGDKAQFVTEKSKDKLINKIGQLDAQGKLSETTQKDMVKNLESILKGAGSNVEITDSLKKEWKEAVSSGLPGIKDFMDKVTGNRTDVSVGENGGIFTLDKANTEYMMKHNGNDFQSNSLAMLAAFGDNAEATEIDGVRTGTVKASVGDMTLDSSMSATDVTQKLQSFLNTDSGKDKLKDVMLRAAGGDTTAQAGLQALMFENAKQAAGADSMIGKDLNGRESKQLGAKEWMSLWDKEYGIDLNEMVDAIGTEDSKTKTIRTVDSLVEGSMNANFEEKDGKYVLKNDAYGMRAGTEIESAEYDSIKDSLSGAVKLAEQMKNNAGDVKSTAAAPGQSTDVLNEILSILKQFATQFAMKGASSAD